MAEDSFDKGTRVFSSDGNIFGTVSDDKTGKHPDGAFLVTHKDQLVSIPRSLIDDRRSTTDTIVLSAAFEPPSDLGQKSGSTLQVHAEELVTRVNETDLGRVRILKSVEHIPVSDDVELARDVVEIERIASDEEYDEVPQSWHDGDTLVVPVVEEVLVLTKRYRVTENVRITKRREVRTERIETDLRREVLTIEEEPETGSTEDS